MDRCDGSRRITISTELEHSLEERPRSHILHPIIFEEHMLQLYLRIQNQKWQVSPQFDTPLEMSLATMAVSEFESATTDDFP